MPKRILVIDDDSLVLKTMRKLLDREGYIAEAAKDAEEGFEKIESQTFDLIICDIRMPQTDGIELMTQVKEIQRNENKLDIPVIFITGYASDEAPIRAQNLGAKDYILKPFDIDKLMESVKRSFRESVEN